MNVPIVQVVERQVAIVVLINRFLQINGVSVVYNKARLPIFQALLPGVNAPCRFVKESLAVADRCSVNLLNLFVLFVSTTHAALPWLARFSSPLTCRDVPERCLWNRLVTIVLCYHYYFLFRFTVGGLKSVDVDLIQPDLTELPRGLAWRILSHLIGKSTCPSIICLYLGACDSHSLAIVSRLNEFSHFVKVFVKVCLHLLKTVIGVFFFQIKS